LGHFPAGQQLGHQVSSTINEGNRMPAKRELTMPQIRQMSRLHRDGVSACEIGRTLGVARSTVQDNLKRAAAAGLAWPPS
jgi:DNA-binding MarR family transcriptional regulator